ncbi:MAG: PQQ-like beta-propeller repeat protein [Gemmataceae bacterium]|nr:PQQ-like beta-propeller repeat protein [Gemmataceae bacterium]
MARWILACVLTCWFVSSANADNWPGWRGATGQGQCTEKGPPLTWSAKENVRWKVKLPDSGSSTPIVWGDRVFVTQASEKSKWPPKGGKGGQGGPSIARKRSLLCLDRADGTLKWQRDVIYEELESTHPTNPFGSASPVTDGERIVVSHGSAGVYCYDFSGKELWKVDVGKLEHDWGNASSPILHGDLAIQWCGPGERVFLLAVNKKTGAKVWQHDEPGTEAKDYIGSWSTPLIAKVNGQDQLILGVPKTFKGFDPESGKVLWTCAGLGNLVYTSPLFARTAQGEDIAVQFSGFGGPALAVKLGGTGDITKERLWHITKKNPQRIGSGVIVGAHIFMLSENGTPQCFELTTGKELWEVKERPGGGAWGSMVHADGRLYITDRGGSTMVFAADPKKFELLATNRLNEHVDASIVIANGDAFIRSFKHLWCIGK